MLVRLVRLELANDVVFVGELLLQQLDAGFEIQLPQTQLAVLFLQASKASTRHTQCKIGSSGHTSALR